MNRLKDMPFALEYFNNVWDMLARQGACDARGGMEYLRVWGEWNFQLRPTPVTRFIVATANTPPSPPTSPLL